MQRNLVHLAGLPPGASLHRLYEHIYEHLLLQKAQHFCLNHSDCHFNTSVVCYINIISEFDVRSKGRRGNLELN